jgi:hypothetical protein
MNDAEQASKQANERDNDKSAQNNTNRQGKIFDQKSE